MDWLTDILGIGASAATGGLVGAFVRFVPELLKIWTAKADRAHEIAMRKLDAEIAMSGAEQRIREADVRGSWEAEKAQLEALREALAGQSRVTGDRYIDRLNQSVRPVITYWFMALWSLTKLAVFLIAGFSKDVGWENALALLWGFAEMQMLCGILGFWFVDRQLSKRANGV